MFVEHYPTQQPTLAVTGDGFEDLQKLQTTLMGYNLVFVRVNGRTDGQAESENEFHFMTK